MFRRLSDSSYMISCCILFVNTFLISFLFSFPARQEAVKSACPVPSRECRVRRSEIYNISFYHRCQYFFLSFFPFFYIIFFATISCIPAAPDIHYTTPPPGCLMAFAIYISCSANRMLPFVSIFLLSEQHFSAYHFALPELIANLPN